MRELEARALSTDSDYDQLLERIGEARIVMLGAASHGTQELYRERCRITKRLIEERDRNVVAAVTDWGDAYRVNRYVQGAADDENPEQALRDFCRFPTWDWRNAETLDFVAWLREHNDRTRYVDPVAFHGLDLYSFFRAAARVNEYLESVDPAAAELARAHYAVLGHFDMDPGDASARALPIDPADRHELLAELVQLQLRTQSYLRRNGTAVEDVEFYTQQHARLAANAESYYRMLLTDRAGAWRRREQHMAETLEQLLENLERRGNTARAVVWAHNSHVGDARHTEMGERGGVSLGQLARQRWPDEVVLIGFTNYAGTVTASSAWQGAVQRMRLRPALQSSYEAVFHGVDEPQFYLDLHRSADPTLRDHRIQRGIGVIYRADTEFASHFFSARIAGQFDAVIHIDEASALEPIDRDGWADGEPAGASPSPS
jgi:erythromycin esterase-like protein